MNDARAVLRDTFGYSEFRGQQAEIIQAAARGEHTLVIMPTGGGKSLCYQIPSLLRAGCGVVVSPLIALMQDQVAALKQLDIRAAYLNSTLSAAEVYAVESALRNGELDLLYIAPERLNQSRTQSLLQSVDIALFAIDEAHCVSQWGHDFRADYLQLDQLEQLFPQVPRIALTATADERTQKEILERLGLQGANAFVAGFDRPNIRYEIALKKQPKQQLLRFIESQHKGSAGIVYCLSRKKTESIAEWLCSQGLTALPYHAGLSHELRAQHQERFLCEDGIIVVATIAFGMGIDKPDVRFVAHLDLPKSIESYYQETGRAGRDGQAADAWMVYGLEDVIKLREMMGQNGVDETNSAAVAYKRVEQQKLDAMLGLCEVISCRRRALLNYFGEKQEKDCGNCDTCLVPPDTWDGTEAAQKALSAVYRTGQRFGVNHVVDVLLGKETDKAFQFDHHHLGVFGIGKFLNHTQWRSVFRQLIAQGLLNVDFNRYNALVLTEACRPVLRGEKQLLLSQSSDKPATAKTVKRKADRPVVHYKNKALWEALRECRSRLAKEKGVPPFVIFHDTTLVEIAEMQPQTFNEFGRINGVGTAKLEQYAGDFLAVVTEYSSLDESSVSVSNDV